MELNNLTKEQLLIKCKEMGYLGIQNKKKDELIELINNIDINYLSRKKLISKCVSLRIKFKKSITKKELITLFLNQKKEGAEIMEGII